MKKAGKILFPLISVSAVIAIFYIIAAIVGDDMIIPSPTAVFAEFFSLFTKKVFYSELLANLLRTLLSFTAAFILASVTAISAARSETVKRLFYPLVTAVRAVPTMAIFLWCLIIFRSSVSPMAVAFIVIFPMLYSAVYGAVSSRDKKLDEMAKLFGVGRAKIIFKMIIPDVWNRLFPQFTSVLSFTVKLIVAGEVLAYTKTSLGREMQIANINLETARLFALTVAVILLSVTLELAVKLLNYALLRLLYGRNRRKINEKIR